MFKGKHRTAAEVIVFSIITCGIYFLYWLYKFAEEMKMYTNAPDTNPGLDLFLCIVCFPYSIYWMYKYGKLLNDAQAKAGLMVEDNTILCLLLTVFGLGVVSAAIFQNTANKVWAATF